MTADFVLAWLRAFVLTQAVEAPIYRFGYRATLPVALLASAITHPIVWFVFFGPLAPFPSLGYLPRVLLAELFAWLTEAAWLAITMRRDRALLWSAIANLASVAVGLVARALLGFP
ncbi:MAG: hypothetical protein ABW252_13830 [Polyangiales bacterium]